MTQSYVWSNWISVFIIYVKLNGLWINFNPMFSTTSVMSFVFVLCIVADEHRERCKFLIMPVNIPRSYENIYVDNTLKPCDKKIGHVCNRSSTVPNWPESYRNPSPLHYYKVCRNDQNPLPLNFTSGTSKELSNGGGDKYQKRRKSLRGSPSEKIFYFTPPLHLST